MLIFQPKINYGCVLEPDSDSSSEEELVVNQKAFVKLHKKHRKGLKEKDKDKEIRKQAYTIKVLQATTRQYKTKIKKYVDWQKLQ